MILLAAALLPPFYLFYKIYTKDRIEPESSKLIFRLFLAAGREREDHHRKQRDRDPFFHVASSLDWNQTLM